MTNLPLATRITSRLSRVTRAGTRRQAYHQLNELDNRLLQDIGLTRLGVDIMRRMR